MTSADPSLNHTANDTEPLAPGNRFGGFFEVEFGTPDPSASPSETPDPELAWRPLIELLSDPAHARAKVERSRELMVSRLGGPPPHDRVLASITFLGISARLIAPWFGAALLTNRVPPTPADQLWWRPFDGGAMPLLVAPRSSSVRAASAEPSRTEPSATTAARELLAGPVRTLIAPLLALYRQQFALSELVLWGNVASGVAGAARAIALVEPPLASAAAELADALLRQGELSGTADLPAILPAGSSLPRPGGWQIRRRSCCLFYRVPGAGTCADCVLNAVEPGS
jgi:hypothetical protein